MGISNAQYQDIMYQYDQIRLKNHHIAEERYAEVCEKIPEIHSIQQQIVQLSADYARQELLNPGKNSYNSSTYIDRKKALKAKKCQLLTDNGYPADYLAPIYNCKLCHDTGYIDNKPCQCLKQRKIALLYQSSNIMEVLKSENFSTFSEKYYDDQIVNDNVDLTPRQNIIRIKNICLDYVKNFDNTYNNIIFYGPAGVGKSFMTHCIAKALLDTLHTVVYLTAIQLFTILEENKFGNGDNSVPDERQISDIFRTDLLIIDDLGTELVNSFTSSQLYHFIEERHLNRKPTIISTNLSFTEMRNKYNERIFSRFTGYYDFYMIIGNDLRIKLKPKFLN